MSILYTADIVCDTCNNWTGGITGDKPPTKASAFAARHNQSYRQLAKGKHICGKCVIALAAITAEQNRNA